MLHLDDVLKAISARGRELGLNVSYQDSVRLTFEKGAASVNVVPVMHTSEIETELKLEKEYRQDTVQEWLGHPIKAYMFSTKSFNHVVENVVETVISIFEKTGENPEQAALELDAVGDRLSAISRQNWIREEANEAWKVGRYADVIRLYSELKPNLSRVEAKRLQLSRERLQ